ncbi:hypothetical protein [Aeromicrobium sp. UC242_57]|uniref:hypothetical protein n=1 Tax=Aeromicrobium sp. UC242_57 TaxID=3374624 RepID=UPI0037AE9B4E
MLTEHSTPGQGFLADVSHAWEAAAAPAIAAGARTCFVRTSLVLDPQGGVLEPCCRCGSSAAGLGWATVVSTCR